MRVQMAMLSVFHYFSRFCVNIERLCFVHEQIINEMVDQCQRLTGNENVHFFYYRTKPRRVHSNGRTKAKVAYYGVSSVYTHFLPVKIQSIEFGKLGYQKKKMSNTQCREMVWLIQYCTQLIERNHLQSQAASIISVVEAQRECDTVPLVIATISHIIKATLRCEHVALFKADPNSKLIIQIYPFKARISSLSAGLLGHVVRTKRFVVYNSEEEKTKQGVEHLNLEKAVNREHESAIFVPVLDDENRTHGIILAMNRLQDVPFAFLDIDMLQLVAIELSALLEKSATKILLDDAINCMDDSTLSLLEYYRSANASVCSISDSEQQSPQRENPPSFQIEYGDDYREVLASTNTDAFEQDQAQPREKLKHESKFRKARLLRALNRKSEITNLFTKRLQQLSRNANPSENQSYDDDNGLGSINTITEDGTVTVALQRAATLTTVLQRAVSMPQLDSAQDTKISHVQFRNAEKELAPCSQSLGATSVINAESVALALVKPQKKSAQSKKQRRKSSVDLKEIQKLRSRIAAPVAKALGEILSLQFDPFNHSPEELGELAISIFMDLDLIQRIPGLTLASGLFESFIKNIFLLYRNTNPYHNVYHGFSVLSFSYSFVKRTDLLGKFPALDVFALLVSALCHDVDHPGNTNAFEIATDSELAQKHNDQSVLENHHCNVTFSVMRKKDCDFLIGFSNTDRRRFRKIVIQSILATDMSHHFELCSTLDQIDKGQFHQNLMKQEKTDKFKQIICNVFVHTADLTAPVQPLVIALKWGKRVCQEFTNQVQKEEELGLESLPMMQGLEQKENFLKSQQGFYKFVLRPLFKSVSRLWPDLNDLYLQLLNNEQYITDELDRIQGSSKPKLQQMSSTKSYDSACVRDTSLRRSSEICISANSGRRSSAVSAHHGVCLKRSSTRLATKSQIKKIFDEQEFKPEFAKPLVLSS